MADRARLESECLRKGTVGSTPTLSAISRVQYSGMSHDFLGFLALHYDPLFAFALTFLRERKATADFLRQAAPRLQQAFPADVRPERLLAWARAALAVELRETGLPMRRPSVLAALAAAFERRPPRRPELLDAALHALSQDALPVLSARYEKELPLESIAHRFRNTPENAFGALLRIRRVLLQALQGRIPHELCRIHELAQKHLESTASPAEAQELAAAVTRDPKAADLFADAALLDAELSACYCRDADGPDEGATLALHLASRPRARRVTRRD